MPYDGSGNFVRTFPPGGWQGDATAGIKIKSDRHDQHDNDLAQGLSNAITKDGQSSPTADIPMNGKKIVNMANPIGPQDAATKAYADLPKPYTAPVEITGSYPESAIKFTGTIGPWGIQFPDLYFGVRQADAVPVPPTINRFVWNDKADSTGKDLMTLNELGVLELIQRADDDVARGPTFNLTRYRDHTAGGDDIGQILFNSYDAEAKHQNYASITSEITASSPVNTGERGALSLNVVVNGTNTTRLTANVNGVSTTGILNSGGSSVFTGAARASDVPPAIWHGQPAALIVDYAGPASDYGSIWSNRNLSVPAQPCLWLWSSGPVGSIQVSGSGVVYGTTSDINTKGSVKSASSTRAMIDALQVIEYRPEPPIKGGERLKFQPHEGYAPASEDPVWIGLSAQQAYTVYPQAVIPAPTMPGYDAAKQFQDEGFIPWQMDYSKLVPMLIANLQEANARIDALEARIAVLEGAP